MTISWWNGFVQTKPATGESLVAFTERICEYARNVEFIYNVYSSEEGRVTETMKATNAIRARAVASQKFVR